VRLARLAIVAVALGCVIAPGAMGRVTDDSRQAPNAADAVAARKTVVRRSDLRPTSGWSGVVSALVQPGGHSNSCLKLSDLIETGRAFSQWSRGAPLGDPVARNVASFTTIYRTPEMARLHLNRIMSRRYFGCEATVGVRQTQVTVEEVAFPRLGASSRAMRLSYTQAGYHRVSEILDVVQGRAELLTSEIVPASQQSALHADVVRLAQLTLSRAP